MWLRGGVGLLLLEGRRFDSPGLHVEVSLGKIILKCSFLSPQSMAVPSPEVSGLQMVGVVTGSAAFSPVSRAVLFAQYAMFTDLKRE